MNVVCVILYMNHNFSMWDSNVEANAFYLFSDPKDNFV